MPPPRQITDWLNTNYPRPVVDPEWLEGCCNWITNERNLDLVRDFPAYIEALEHQLLQSSLQDSMLPHTGLPANIGDVNTSTTLTGPPVLVEVIHMDDVSTSAFQLDQIRQAREERMRAGVGNEEGEEDGDVDVEGEGPMPQYPRGKLRLQLSDGHTVLEALEYRRINELKLTTPHGFKMQLKNVRIQRGMAFLEPTTVILKGGQVEDLVQNQEFNFANGLRFRMGLPLNEPPEPQPEEDPPQPLQEAAAIMRSPLREISPPPSPPLFPQRNDDEDLEPRRRKVPKNNSPSSSIPTSRPIAGLPLSFTSLGGVSTARSATLVGSNGTSSHFPFSGPQINVVSVENARLTKGRGMGLNLPPTIRQTAPNLPSAPTQEPEEASFDFELLDELDENQPPSKPIANSNKGKGRAADATTTKTKAELSDEFPSSDDYGIDNMNDDFWRELDEAEASADRSSLCAPTTTSSSSSGLGSSWSAVERKTGGAATRDTLALSAPLEVISIDSDDDLMSTEDKENVPIPTRHVRRRTEDDWEGFGGGGLSQRRDRRPVILATNPDDILDLTDSE